MLPSRNSALLLLAIVFAWAGLHVPAEAKEIVPPQLQGVGLDENLGGLAAVDATFMDHNGKSVTLKDYLADGLPVMLTLNYYRCETLCSFQLNTMLTGLKSLEWTPGEKFRVVTVSIDPTETAELAAAKRANYLEDYGRGADVEWSFLTGNQTQIEALADSIGFRYQYIEDEEQYSHPAAATFLAPDGTITRYLAGLTYEARDIRFALMEASDGTVGNPIEQFVFSCYRYDYVGGKYTPFAFGVMRAAGSLTVMGLVLLVGFLLRQERLRAQMMENPT